jgi:hypothetical protein
MGLVIGCSQEFKKTPVPVQAPPSIEQIPNTALAEKKVSSTKIQIEPDEKACTRDAQCVLVKRGCCSCNSGGVQDALNKAHLNALKERRVKGCVDVGCLAVVNDAPICKASLAQCVKGKCEVKVPAQPKIKTMPIE